MKYRQESEKGSLIKPGDTVAAVMTERVEIRQANELDIKKEIKMVRKKMVVIQDMKKTPTLHLFGFHMKENRVLMK